MVRLRASTGPAAAPLPPRAEPPPVSPPLDARRDARPPAPEGAIAEAPEVAIGATTPVRVSDARRSRRRATIAGVASVAVVAALGWRAVASARGPDRPVLAVGLIRDLVTPDSAGLGGVLSEMLATSLARLPELQVIANSRMLELTPREGERSRSALTDAARRAGATEILEGELIPRPDRRLSLDLRRVDIARGRVRDAYRIVGTDRFGLLDSATILVAAGLRLDVPAGSLAERSTRSPIAYRLYEEGLRAFYQFDVFAANRLFRAAVQEDSAFAMAVYYAWRSGVGMGVGDSAQRALADRAMALASRAPERDRLLVFAHVGFTRDDPRALPAAETLGTRYAHDPEALIRAAEAMPDLAPAAVLLDRAIALDSAAAVSPTAVCRVCDAFALLVKRYQRADSGLAVERTLSRWTALRPDDAMPWHLRADWLIGAGRRAAADTARARYESMGGERGDAAERALLWSLRSDDYEAANAQCEAGLASRDTLHFTTWRRYCAIALRAQGRYREALALLREGRGLRSGMPRRDVPADPYHSALLDLEMGRPHIAANAFLALSRERDAPAGLAGLTAPRRRAWLLTLAATAAVAGNDTIRARALADSMETAVRGRLLGQEALLHHFVRGVLFSRAGQHRAAVRELRAALAAPAEGYPRINHELGQSLLALSRAAEAIPIVRAALHGPVDGPNLALTRTEVHELLARLFAATGSRDSAAAHYAVVARSWRVGDPPFRARSDSARAWLTGTGRVGR
jgi:TolB-like protein